MSSSFARVLLSGILITGSGFSLADDKRTTRQSSLSDFYNLSLAELGQIEISIATGNSTPLDKAPATASVIYAAEINAMGARTLNDILETVPGLHVSLSSLSRLDSIYSMRGIHTGFNAQVLLLMNGVPVQYSLQGGRPTLFRLPVTSIDRIEVIRGPGSAIYGADAYAGVINVITKDANAIAATEFGMRAGSFSSNDFWVQTSGRWNGIGIAFDMTYQESEGDDSRLINADLQTTLDETFGTSASLAPGPLSTRYQIMDSHLSLSTDQLQLNMWNWLSTNAGVGAGAAQALDARGQDDGHLFMTDLTYHLQRWSAPWENKIRASYMYYDIQTLFQLFPDGAALPIGSDGNLDIVAPVGVVQFPDGLFGNPGALMTDTQIEFVSLYTGWDSHRLRWSAGARRQSLKSRETKNFGPGVIDGTLSMVTGALTDVSDTPFVYLDDSARNLQYLSLQDEWQMVADLNLTAGVRYDRYSDFGSTINPRIALVWAATGQLTTKLLYGSAFRAPSFAELYFKNNPVSLGNPNLKPENIDTYELSFNYHPAHNVQTTLTLFTYEATDIIDFISDDDSLTTKTAQNAKDRKGKGLEWEINWKPTPQLRLNTNYAWQDTKDIDTNTSVADAPGQQFMLNMNWEFKANWFINGQLNRVVDRRRALEDPRGSIKDYTLINLTLHKKNVFRDLNASLSLRNLTDEDAREPSSGEIAEDYPMEARSIWIELQYLLK